VSPEYTRYCFPGILDQQNELERINWSRFKTESLIETACPIIFCMNKNCSNPSVLRNLKRPEDSVFKKTFTDVLSLIPKIHSEPRAQGTWFGLSFQRSEWGSAAAISRSGNGVTLFQSMDFRPACHRSYFFCKLSHKSGVVLNARDNLSAISGVMELRSFKRLETVFLETPICFDKSDPVIFMGARYSRFNIPPGWFGTLFLFSMSPSSVIIFIIDSKGITLTKSKSYTPVS